MCLTPADNRKACCKQSPTSVAANKIASELTLPDSQQPLTFIMELMQSPPGIVIRHPNSGKVLAEFNGQACLEFFNPDENRISPANTTIMEAVMAAAAPMMPTGGLTSQPLEAPIGEEGTAPTRKTRRKLWELPHKLHCSVIGTCLDAGELRRIIRKAGAQAQDELTEYDVHASFVTAADHKNSLSLTTHKALERKYASHIKRFSRAKTTERLSDLWEEALARGEVPPALWATLTHPRCDDALKTRVFEEVHMLSHQIGAGQRADLKRLTEVETELQCLQRDFDAQHKRTRRQLEDREQHIQQLTKQVSQYADENRRRTTIESELRHELAETHGREDAGHITQLESEVASKRHQLSASSREVARWQHAAEYAELRASRIEDTNRELTAECETMERFITQSLTTCDTCENTECGSRPDLGGRRILCVGGRNRLIEHYREVVARCNGRFQHHDGGIEDNRQRLDALLSSADAIVCATDNVSHDAYHRLKRFCKRNEKPHVFLRNSGISSFTHALYRVAP